MHSIGLGTYKGNLSKYSSHLELFEESLGGQVNFDHATYLSYLMGPKPKEGRYVNQ